MSFKFYLELIIFFNYGELYKIGKLIIWNEFAI